MLLHSHDEEINHNHIHERNYMKRSMYLFIVTTMAVCSVTVGQVVKKPEKPDHYFLTKLGNDTLAVEEFSINSHEIQGTSIARAPRLTVRKYKATFGDDGLLTHFHVTYQRFSGQFLSERDYTYTNDSVHVVNKQDTMTTKYSVATSEHPFPLFYDIFAGWQATVQNALNAKGKKEFSILAGRQIYHYDVQETASGKFDLINPTGDFSPLHAVVDKMNQVESFDMTATTDKVVVEKVAELDVKEAVIRYAAAEKAGKQLGVLSPGDSVRATINGAKIFISYSRPSMRGRTIFGQVVPWDVVWRTGANAATQLMTDKDLTFGTTVVPAGTYTLFTLPSQSGWKLIINSQHGQWGTDYDQKKDFARLPLTVTKIDDAVERFTFEITSEGSGGTIHLKWENTDASIPFTVK